MNRIPSDPDSIRRLALMMAETGVTEIELVEKDSRIRVVRGGAVVTTALAPVAAAPVAVPAAVVATTADSEHPGAITSPMVGVAYLAREPGAPHFVAVGQSVSAGQTVLLIEAMKTFNEIKAPKSGIVSRILVANSAPVEYGEVLMILD